MEGMGVHFYLLFISLYLLLITYLLFPYYLFITYYLLPPLPNAHNPLSGIVCSFYF